MPTLLANSPLEGAVAHHGDTHLSELPPVPVHWLAPYPGAAHAFAETLRAGHDLPFPGPGERARSDTAEIRWAGRMQALLLGPEALDAGLAEHGAVVDVSDVYARLLLAGPSAPDILARLVPLDLRLVAFPEGRTARTLLGHINALITRTPEGVELTIMQSFAPTAFHEIERAMRAVAARA